MRGLALAIIFQALAAGYRRDMSLAVVVFVAAVFVAALVCIILGI
jgi:hypothetical protein